MKILKLLKTERINKLATRIIALNQGGRITSENYNGVIDESGNITQYGNSGFSINGNGQADFVGVHTSDMLAEKALLKSSLHLLGTTYNATGTNIKTMFNNIRADFPNLESGYNKPILCSIVVSFAYNNFRYKITSEFLKWSVSGNYYVIQSDNATGIKTNISTGTTEIKSINIEIGTSQTSNNVYFKATDESGIIVYQEGESLTVNPYITISL